MTNMITTALTSVSETVSATVAPTEDNDTLGAVLSGAANTVDREKDKIERFLSFIGDKFISALPAIGMALIFLVIGLLLSKLAIHIFKNILGKSKVDNAAVSFLCSVLKAFLYVIVLIITLSILNVPMTSLIAVLSAAGLAVGLALQGSLSNLAGGFIILVSKPFKAGDFIETNSCSGYVESISILYTKILTLDNKTVYIPNGSVTGATITNFSEKGERRIDHEFAISYGDDPELAKRIILETAKKNPCIRDTPAPPFARIKAHGEDSIIIKSEVWAKSEDYWKVFYDMFEQVYAAFSENGITIPFRQLDVHMIPEKKDKEKDTGRKKKMTNKNGDDKKNGKQQQQ